MELAVVTCAGGISIGNGPDGLGSLLRYHGLPCTGLLVVTLGAVVVYFFVWISQKLEWE